MSSTRGKAIVRSLEKCFLSLDADLFRQKQDETSGGMALDSPVNEDLSFLIPSRRLKHIGLSSDDG